MQCRLTAIRVSGLEKTHRTKQQSLFAPGGGSLLRWNFSGTNVAGLLCCFCFDACFHAGHSVAKFVYREISLGDY